MRIVHLTSAHPRDDIRIFIKMCTSLAGNYNVSSVVADGFGNISNDVLSIFDVGAPNGGRLSRMTRTVRLIYKKAILLDAQLYHLHDPELLPIALKLKRLGKVVIFDAHEDLPKQLLAKPYLAPQVSYVLSNIFRIYEKWVCSKLDAVIGATPVITAKFNKYCSLTENINNHPILNDINVVGTDCKKLQEIVYVGRISEIRGIKPLVKSLSKLKGVRLNLIGEFGNKEIKKEVKSLPEFKLVNELGFKSRNEVADILARSKIGIVTFLATPNHVDAQPNKMFEYMSAGLPVVTSNFPLWREIVEGNKCGICVDPEDIDEIASAIQYLVDNPIEAERMGGNGRKAVMEKYNWEQEEKKLLKLYKNLLPF